MKNKKDKIELTEIFMAKAGNDFNRCYHGTIKRDVDADGNPYVFGNIKVNDGYIIARGIDQWKLGEKLDELVLMNLDYGLHNDAGMTCRIIDTDLFLN